ncbi:MAG: peptidylprolyl isomerase [Reichenbachiella sp.]|uniref:peptidylprolyl isomerase n=1 Tax=Reichenbachiella sp. TaxID=2184521 RepID=UPI003265FE51
MRHFLILLFVSIGLCQCKEKTIVCVVDTAMGQIKIELYPEKAPITVANFLKYVDSGLYEQSSFFRACTPKNEADREVRIEVIQGGDIPVEKELDPIEIETTQQTGLLHEDGTISMARDQPNSATCSFFICIGNQPSLDFDGARNPDGYGFAAFGQVLEGMDVVRKIQEQEEVDQYFIDPVRIINIKRID